MIVEIEMDDLLKLVKHSAEQGAAAYIHGLDADKDYVNQTDCKQIVKSHGFRPVMLGKWVTMGRLHPVKTGPSRNSAVKYSRSELLNLLTTLHLQKTARVRTKTMG